MLHNYCIFEMIAWFMALLLAKRTERRHPGKCRSEVKWSGFFPSMLNDAVLQNYFLQKSFFT